MEKWNYLTLLVGIQIDTTSMENSSRFLKKLGIKLSYNPAIPLLGICLEKTTVEKDAPQCSLQYYLQKLGHGSNLDSHQQMNG